jgi:amino acid transporter
LVTTLYVLANIAYLAVLGAEAVAQSSTIAMLLGYQVWGTAGAYFFALMVVLSTFGAVNGNVWAASRVMVAAAQDGIIFPKFLAHHHRSREAPIRALILTGIIGSLWCLPGDFTYLANIYSFIGWLWYGITIAGLVYMRFSADMKAAERPFKVWLPIAVLFVVLSCYLVVAPLVDAGPGGVTQYVICILIGLLAVPAWFIRMHKPALGRRLLGWIPGYQDVTNVDTIEKAAVRTEKHSSEDLKK